MALLKIITVGHQTLSKKAEPVSEITDEVRELAMNMVETMHEAPGIGLSAPQVNVSKRLITVDLSVGKDAQELFVLINPEITEAEGEAVSEEGCLSVPGITEKVARPARVMVKGLDLEGREWKRQAEDLLARVFCHEIDHLNGKLFIEKLSPLKRQLIKRKLKKELRSSETA